MKIWILAITFESCKNIKNYQVLCLFFVLQVPDIFMKSTTHCNKFCKCFLHIELHVMCQKWRFIYMVTRSHTQGACLYVTAVDQKKQIHRGQKHGNTTIKRAMLKFYQRYENKTKKVKNNLKIFLTLFYENLGQRKVFYQ